MAGTGCWPGADGDRKECALQMLLVSVGYVPCHMQNGGHMAWLSPVLYLHLLQKGRSSTEQVTSRKGGVCFSASGKGEIVPSGNWAELLRERAVLRGRAGGVALLTVMVTP